jgi:hypothetical protein
MWISWTQRPGSRVPTTQLQNIHNSSIALRYGAIITVLKTSWTTRVSHCLLFPLMWIATLFFGCNSYPSRFAKSRAMLTMICASLSWVLSSATSSAHPVLLTLMFDKVVHSHLFRRMYHAGIQDKTWTIIKSLHHNAESCIKWERNTSDCFKVGMGDRQGSILSALCRVVLELLAGYTSGHSLLISPTRSIVIFW